MNLYKMQFYIKGIMSFDIQADSLHEALKIAIRKIVDDSLKREIDEVLDYDLIRYVSEND